MLDPIALLLQSSDRRVSDEAGSAKHQRGFHEGAPDCALCETKSAPINCASSL
jgi:hypothetical protein